MSVIIDKNTMVTFNPLEGQLWDIHVEYSKESGRPTEVLRTDTLSLASYVWEVKKAKLVSDIAEMKQVVDWARNGVKFPSRDELVVYAKHGAHWSVTPKDVEVDLEEAGYPERWFELYFDIPKKYRKGEPVILHTPYSGEEPVVVIPLKDFYPDDKMMDRDELYPVGVAKRLLKLGLVEVPNWSLAHVYEYESSFTDIDMKRCTIDTIEPEESEDE
jgi:hypothetical protein